MVPETVEIIDEYAFQKNVNLKKVMLPSSLRRIEDGAFFHYAKLAIINLPESLEYIGEGCFELSFKIDRLVIPKNIKSIKTSFFAYASIVFILNNSIELEYDSITTNYIDIFTGPAILSDGNEEIVDFAETYDYPHFENCFEDKNGIIWADHGRILISFPSDWKSEEYELPEEIEEVYLDAFKSSAVKQFYSKHKA